MPKKAISTFEREMQNPKFKKTFEKGYKQFLLSELILALMEGDEKSVRALAKEVGLSTSVIQKLRSGEQGDVKASNFVSIMTAFGYKVVLEKGRERIVVKDEIDHGKHHLNFAFASA